jgi:hypothetical protein
MGIAFGYYRNIDDDLNYFNIKSEFKLLEYQFRLYLGLIYST